MELQTTTEDTTVSQSNGLDQDFSGNGTDLRLPTSVQPEESHYWGALTGTKAPGINEHVVYPDLSAMYPNIMRTLNISPDTIIGTPEDLRESEYTEEDTVHGYIDTRSVKRCEEDESWQEHCDGEYKAVFAKNSSGDWKKKWDGEIQHTECHFLRPDVKRGFITDLVDELIEVKNGAKGTDLYSSTKAVVNSVYGLQGYATEHNAFRLFDHRIAEAVTIVGRLILRHTMDEVVEYSEREYDTNAYVTHMDTDGCGVALDVDGQSEALEIAHNAVEGLRESGYGTFLENACGFTEDLLDHHTLDAEVEYYASRIYNHDKKKRYAARLEWDEGEGVDEIDITGFDAIRSDVSDITVEVQTEVFSFILRNELREVKDDLYSYINEKIESVENGDVPVEQLGVRSGVGQELSEYGSESRRPHPRICAAKHVNKHVDGENIGEASKPLSWPIRRITDDSIPVVFSADTAEDGDVVETIAAEDPTNVKDKVVFDYDELAEDTIIDRIRPIIENIDGLSWVEMKEGHSESTLDQFM